MSASEPARKHTRAGFSLMELMIVVVITGILAAIAIPTFTGYVMKSRTSEAVQFLGVIKLRQEAYRAEFGQYYQYNALVEPKNITASNVVPVFSHPTTQQMFPTDQYFNTLGARPDGPVRFGYMWAAGTPTITADLTAYGIGAAHDHYFVAQAIGNLNDDATYCTFEVTSFTRTVWFWPARGWD